jgi:hypothetical protein
MAKCLSTCKCAYTHKHNSHTNILTYTLAHTHAHSHTHPHTDTHTVRQHAPQASLHPRSWPRISQPACPFQMSPHHPCLPYHRKWWCCLVLSPGVHSAIKERVRIGWVSLVRLGLHGLIWKREIESQRQCLFCSTTPYLSLSVVDPWTTEHCSPSCTVAYA